MFPFKLGIGKRLLIRDPEHESEVTLSMGLIGMGCPAPKSTGF